MCIVHSVEISLLNQPFMHCNIYTADAQISTYMFRHSAEGDFVYLLCVYSSAYKIDFISWKFWEFLCRMCSSQYAAFAFSVILKVWSSFAVTVGYVTACSVWHVVIAMYCYDHRHLVCVAQLYGAFALLKATLSFVSSVRPHGTTRNPLDGFSCNLIFGFFSKIFGDNSSLIEIR